MAKLLLMLTLCAVFAAAILAGPGSPARQKPANTTVTVVATTTSDSSTTVVVKGHGVGHMHS